LNKKPFVLAGIPAYNEENSIAKVILKTQKHVNRIIVCDDGSTDLTGEIAEKLGTEVIRHETNQGYGAAIRTIFKSARVHKADILVTLDGDGQHNPDEMESLIKPILNGEADITVGSRFKDKKSDIPRYRSTGVKAITGLTDTVSGLDLKDAQCGFRAYSKKVFLTLLPSEYGMGVSTEILLKASKENFKITEVPVSVQYDGLDSSELNPVYHGLDVILSTLKQYSIRHPLIFYGIPGFVALLVALSFWIWTLQLFANTGRVVTNITLVALGSTIIGLMLLTTSILLWVLISVFREKQI
jgi:glycosyltransferase involved in cell wall biosynthesis